jgi:hypothetical protein
MDISATGSYSLIGNSGDVNPWAFLQDYPLAIFSQYLGLIFTIVFIPSAIFLILKLRCKFDRVGMAMTFSYLFIYLANSYSIVAIIMNVEDITQLSIASGLLLSAN